MFEIGSVVLEKFGFEKMDPARLGNSDEQSFILFSETKFEVKIKLGKPLNGGIWIRKETKVK